MTSNVYTRREGVHPETRWVMNDACQIEQTQVDITNVTGRVAFYDEDKVFKTEREAREHARDICDALHVKFASIRDQHDDWLKAHPELKVGDRVKDRIDNEEGTIIAFAKSGSVVVEFDIGYVYDDQPSRWIKIEE